MSDIIKIEDSNGALWNLDINNNKLYLDGLSLDDFNGDQEEFESNGYYLDVSLLEREDAIEVALDFIESGGYLKNEIK